ncbi:MAG: hypothetical protein GDA56_15875 [Hormoscilla sp. GM7CHS1pb]|nr:hypothetical protein [Hormoscilla sp. GM7CHS1pb]
MRGLRKLVTSLSILLAAAPAWCQPQTPSDLDLSPEIIESSPVLQRWQRQVPSVWSDIKHDPSFPTRLRLGYSLFPDSDDAAGFNFGIEDLFIGRSGLTISADYYGTGDRPADFRFRSAHPCCAQDATQQGGRSRKRPKNRTSYGADLRYYLRPLGSYINIAPVVGYRHLETDADARDGINIGLRLLLVPSRGGGADIALTQSFVSLGSGAEVGLATLSFGYAITPHLRLSTDIQQQNSRSHKDSRFGILLEWIP